MAAAGDSRAFATIYERYHQPIYRYCHSILHDPDDAADALQNAMVKALRGLQGSERDIALKPWLFRIAHHEAISLIRRRRASTPIEEAAVPAGQAVEDNAAARERMTQLVSDLKELPERQRGALLMRELAGLEFTEIAEAFGVSAAAAKQTVYEARTALHEYVDGRRMRCEDARQALSAGDRRMLRGRKLSAHLRDCAGCRDFEEIMRLRHRDVAALAPPISAGASAAILKGILGGGTAAGGGGGIAGWIAGAKTVGGSHSVQSLVTAALVTASAGAVGVVSAIKSDSSHAAEPSGAAVATPHPRAASTHHGYRSGGQTGSRRQTARHPDRSSGPRGGRSVPSSGGGSNANASSQTAAGGQTDTSDGGAGSAAPQASSTSTTGSSSGVHPLYQTRRDVGQIVDQVSSDVTAVTSTSTAQSLPDVGTSSVPQAPPLP